MTISGNITDASGTPLMGVNIYPIRNGSSYGVGGISDYDGNFAITIDDLNADQTIRFSYLGFATRELRADQVQDAQIIMQEEAESLDEVLIIANKPQKVTKLNRNFEYIILGCGIVMCGILIYNIKPNG